MADARVLHLPANVPPRTDAGRRVGAGNALTRLAGGRVEMAGGLWGRPRFYLWGRIQVLWTATGMQFARTTLPNRAARRVPFVSAQGARTGTEAYTPNRRQ